MPAPNAFDNPFATGAHRLDRSSSEPLWAQLERELHRRLDHGDFTERFPTDRELMEAYDVSRHTVRHAVNELGAQGMVKRARGIGSTLDTTTIEQSLGSLYSLFQVVESSGMPQTSEVRRFEPDPDPIAAEHLRVDPATLLLIERLRLAGGRPVAIDRIWLPDSVGDNLRTVDFTRTSLYDEMERVLGMRPNAGWERIRAVTPSADEAEMLDVPTDVGLFAIERLGTHDDEPLEWRTTRLRSDMFCFNADWRLGQRSEVRLELTDPSA